MKVYDVDFSIGDADFCVFEVYAESPRKAKYQAYKIAHDGWLLHKNIHLEFLDFIRFARAIEKRKK